MASTMAHLIVVIGLAVPAIALQSATAATIDMGGGFRNHGVATPTSNHRGTVATVDGEGKDVVLSWLLDYTGCYELLVVDADTGASKEYKIPFASGGDCPYASVLSSKNKLYTHFNSHFLEFDPAKRKFTFCKETASGMAMGMTEDDKGVIWSATYPESGVVSFDPATRAFRDYGHVYAQNWAQYPNYVATDDTGWVYCGIGETWTQIIALNPATGKARPLFRQSDRTQGQSAYVYRDMNGRVYGTITGGQQGEVWYRLYQGRKQRLENHDARAPKPIIAGDQRLFHREFPDGKILQDLDLQNRKLSVKDSASGKVTELPFTYTSSGAGIMGLAAAPNGTIAGGTAFPFRFFMYEPKTDAWVNREIFVQWNTVAPQGDRFFVGAYSAGDLLEWNTVAEWNGMYNPVDLKDCAPAIGRPHALLAHPNGRLVVMGGTPGYGYTGGGLLLWDREAKTGTLLEHTAILPDQSTMSLEALPGTQIIGGTTINAGTGGEVKAPQAELYIMDTTTKQVEWHGAVIPGTRAYTALCRAPNGLVYGFAGTATLFAFDPTTRELVFQRDTTSEFGDAVSDQGPRVFVRAPDGIYILFVKGIAKLSPATNTVKMVAHSPVPIAQGGDYLDGRIYFVSGSSVYSYELPKAGR
jgi:hypothetical protein